MGVSWYRERFDAIVDDQTAGWTVADMRRLRERFIALRHATLTGEGGVKESSPARRSADVTSEADPARAQLASSTSPPAVNVAVLDETGPLLKRTVPGAAVVEHGPVSSSAAACSPLPARPRSTP